MYDFIDAQQMAKDHPDTFEAPTQQELKTLKVGQYAKVCLNDERFWVEVVKIGPANRVSGRIDNDLICDQPFKCDDVITFRKCHIYNILD